MAKVDIDLLFDYVEKSSMCCHKHPKADLYLFGYHRIGKESVLDKWDDVNTMCRGLIVDGKGNIIERAFPKFWTFRQYLSKDMILMNDQVVQKITSRPKHIYEKVDGTMTLLYWIDDEPFLATQKSFTNPKAHRASQILHRKYKHTFSKFDRSMTYLFEARYPETQILVDYEGAEDLVLIGIIDKETGKSLPLIDLGFPICKDRVKSFGKNGVDLEDLVKLNIENQEGFVLVYENDLRVKVKFPWYKNMHAKIDSYLTHKRQIALSQYELKEILKNEFPSIISRDFILRNRPDVAKMKQNIPFLYSMLGFDAWVETCLNSPDEEKFHFFADYDENFDVGHRLNNQHIYETINWKWKER